MLINFLSVLELGEGVETLELKNTRDVIFQFLS